MTILKFGDKGPNVERWQLFLLGQGFDTDLADGCFGQMTLDATIAFQNEHGLGADGIVGPATWAHAELYGFDADAPAAFAAEVLECAADGSADDSCLEFPTRPAGAVTGSQFLEETKRRSRLEREEAIFAEIAAGNIPAFLRKFRRVALLAAGSDKAEHSAVVLVTPDYMAIGSDEDFLRIPMSSLTAQRVADLCNCLLPTRRLVDAIYQQAALTLRPQPLRAGPQMMSNAYYSTHHQAIEQQRGGRATGELTVGHKKDVVVSNRLRARPDRVAIYGWHLGPRKPIQPLSTVHENTYADYSHGLRLVRVALTVDGAPASAPDVLGDPSLCALLSDEGPMPSHRVPGL
jgi:Putative peptidoglycan binding domain